jgi:hypothetical protein
LKSELISNVTGNSSADGAKEHASQAKLEVTAIDSGKIDTNLSSRDTSAKPSIPSVGKITEKTVSQGIYTPGTIQAPSNSMMYSETSQPVAKHSVKPEIRNSTNNTINVVNVPLTGKKSNNVTGQETAFVAQSTVHSVQMVPSGTNNGHANKDAANKYETVKKSVEKNVKNSDVEKMATTMNKTLLNTTHDILQSSSMMNQAVWNTSQETVYDSSGALPNITQGSSKTNKTVQNVNQEAYDNDLVPFDQQKFINVSQPLALQNGSQFIHDVNDEETPEIPDPEDEVGGQPLNNARNVNATTNSADGRALTPSACLLAGAVFRRM